MLSGIEAATNSVYIIALFFSSVFRVFSCCDAGWFDFRDSLGQGEWISSVGKVHVIKTSVRLELFVCHHTV